MILQHYQQSQLRVFQKEIMGRKEHRKKEVPDYSARWEKERKLGNVAPEEKKEDIPMPNP